MPSPTDAVREELQFIVSYLAHNDQDANHAWMVRRIRAVLAGKDPSAVEGWSKFDGVPHRRPWDPVLGDPFKGATTTADVPQPAACAHPVRVKAEGLPAQCTSCGAEVDDIAAVSSAPDPRLTLLREARRRIRKIEIKSEHGYALGLAIAVLYAMRDEILHECQKLAATTTREKQPAARPDPLRCICGAVDDYSHKSGCTGTVPVREPRSTAMVDRAQLWLATHLPSTRPGPRAAEALGQLLDVVRREALEACWRECHDEYVNTGNHPHEDREGKSWPRGTAAECLCRITNMIVGAKPWRT